MVLRIFLLHNKNHNSGKQGFQAKGVKLLSREALFVWLYGLYAKDKTADVI